MSQHQILQSFKLAVDTVSLLADIPLGDISSTLKNRIDSSNGNLPKLDFADNLAKLDFLNNAIALIDPLNELGPWIFDPTLPGDPISVPAAVSHRFSSCRLAFLKAMAVCAYCLGLTWTALQNHHQAFHMFRCALIVWKHVRSPDPSVLFKLYSALLDSCMSLDDFESAQEIGLELLAFQDESLPNASCKTNLPDLPQLKAYYSTSCILLEAAYHTKDSLATSKALIHSLQILHICENQFGPNLITKDSDYKFLDLSLQLLRLGQSGNAQTACLYGRMGAKMHSNELTSFWVEYFYHLGANLYLWVLELAGGPNFAASPPLVLMGTENVNSILQESLAALFHALSLISANKSDLTIRTICLQIAILQLEMRDLEGANSTIVTYHLHECFDQLDSSDLQPNIYSTKALAKLMNLLELDARSESSDATLVLSNKLRHAYSFSFGSKVTCIYCSMSVREAIECTCGAKYCSEECKDSHRRPHLKKCSGRWTGRWSLNMFKDASIFQ